MAAITRRVRQGMMRRATDEAVADALRVFSGDIARAATKLKVTPRTVYRRIEGSKELRVLQLEIKKERVLAQ